MYKTDWAYGLINFFFYIWMGKWSGVTLAFFVQLNLQIMEIGMNELQKFVNKRSVTFDYQWITGY